MSKPLSDEELREAIKDLMHRQAQAQAQHPPYGVRSGGTGLTGGVLTTVRGDHKHDVTNTNVTPTHLRDLFAQMLPPVAASAFRLNMEGALTSLPECSGLALWIEQRDDMYYSARIVLRGDPNDGPIGVGVIQPLTYQESTEFIDIARSVGITPFTKPPRK